MLRYSSVLRSSNVSWRQLSYNRLTPKPNDADPDALKPKKLKLSLRDIMALLMPYSGVRVFEQMKAVVPLSLYLVLFQMLILRRLRSQAHIGARQSPGGFCKAGTDNKFFVVARLGKSLSVPKANNAGSGLQD